MGELPELGGVGEEKRRLPMTEDEVIRSMAVEARKRCPACKDDVPVKGLPTGGLVHLDFMAAGENAAIFECKAKEIIESVVEDWDDRRNPIYRDGWEELMSELWDADEEIWEGKGDEE